ncbi:MAG: cell division protein [Flavobacteriales bacterium]|nr:MAG: cell division protein [Flavobacteriales bacterium]
MDPKKDILWRIYLVYFIVCLFGIAILTKAVTIQFVEGDKWRSKAENLTTRYHNIEAARGNIYAADGSLLATSIPIYEVRMDLNTEAMTDALFNENVDSLAICLSAIFREKSPEKYKRELLKARKDGNRFHLIKRKVRFNQLKEMKNFPLFRLGRYKGGFIYLQQNKRQRPFRVLAARTIGYDRIGIQPVGLEGAYGRELKGVSGKRLMQKIAGGVWMPINDANEIDPKDGNDLYTAIDINIQDVAEYALLKQLQVHDAHHGCVVLMEVQTGEIKAIANLQKDEDGDYYEYYNYAVGESTEPGSTFKLASLMAAIEDGLVDLDDSVDTEDGTTQYYDEIMRDSHKGGFGKITVKRAFEVSSNVGISKIVWQSYSDNPQKFVDRLYKMNLNKPLGIEIAGEGKPYIKNAKDTLWSGITLPWMSIGYEVQLTPLQILTFYNAVANDGKMVKPKFVKEIRDKRNVIKKIDTEVIDDAICSEETISKAQKMLEGVVENGTAQNLKAASYKVAGKTGTAQIANANYGYKYDKKISYQASFVGYFPADNPKYSCIVVVNAPSKDVYYGNLVAGPIFKEVADKVYATSIEIHDELQPQQFASATAIPYSKNGYKRDLQKVLADLQMPLNDQSAESDWVVTITEADKVHIKPKKIYQNTIPNVAGMAVQDAVYLLENMGMQVKIRGKGTVKSQSVTAGSAVQKGQKIVLELS